MLINQIFTEIEFIISLDMLGRVREVDKIRYMNETEKYGGKWYEPYE